jgi:ABC-type transport system involved in multi-copper enzyme maturation permease subunit
MIGGASVVGALLMTMWSMGKLGGGPLARSVPNPIHTFGTTLFGKMNLFIFVSIWLFVPLATADAVSRERREGTLALLFLTELRSFGIVVGKVFVHMLRSVSLFLTMAPWLILPLVFGGVGLKDIGMALMLDFTSVLLAQAAGLLASTIPRDWLKSVILAETFALLLLLTMLSVHGTVLKNVVRVGTPPAMKPGTPGFWNSGLASFWEFYGPLNGGGMIARTRRLIEFTTNASMPGSEVYYGWSRGFGRSTSETVWQQIWTRLTPAGHNFWFLGVAGMVAAAALILLGTTWLGAWRVEKSWQDAPGTAVPPELRRKLFSPRFGVQSFSRRLSRSLSANPIGWLQYYSVSARLVKWGWCLFIILIEIVLSGNSEDLYAAQKGLGLLLLLGLAFSATGSFRDELETGAFELLLVTPLRERQIIVGRVRGLWRQFLPAILVYGMGSIFLATGWRDKNYASEAWLALGRAMITFGTLPLIGLYFSLRRWNFFGAWVGACLVGLLPPFLGRTFGASDGSMTALQIGLAIAAAILLEQRLRNREFLQKR